MSASGASSFRSIARLSGRAPYRAYPTSAKWAVTASGTFSVNIPNPGNDRLVIQIVDAAGNVGFYSAKGPGLRILNVDLGPDRLFFDNQPVAFTANVDQSVEAMVAPVSYFWDFGDGNTLTTQTNSVSHTFNTNALVYEVKVKVADSKGGIGVDRAIVRYYCTDPTGDATSDPTVAHLRTALEQSAKEQKYVNLQIPAAWLACLDGVRAVGRR